MPIFEVTDPSGRKFRVEGPPGSTAEQALEQVRSQSAPPPSTQSAPPLDAVQLRTPEGADAGSIDVLRPFPAPSNAPGGTGPGSAVAVQGRSTAGLASPRPEQSDFAAGVNAGLLNMDATFFGLAGLVGESVGSDGLRDWGLQGYQRMQEGAARVGPRVQGIDQIESLGDFFDAAQGWIGASTPFLATTLMGGGVGGLAGRAVARRAAARMAEKGVDKAVAEKAVEAAMRSPQAQAKILSAIKRGALVGSGAASALTQQGDLYGQLKEAGIEEAALPAWGFGAMQGALDVIPEAMVLKKLLPGQVEQELNKSLIRGLAGTVAKQGAVEGATEGAQQALSSLARITSGGADWNDKDTQDLLTNVAAGAVVGSILGGGAELASKVTAPKGAAPAAPAATPPAGTASSPPPPPPGGGGNSVQVALSKQLDAQRNEAKQRATDEALFNKTYPGAASLNENITSPPTNNEPLNDRQMAALHDVVAKDNWDRIDSPEKLKALGDFMVRAKDQLDRKNQLFETDPENQYPELSHEEMDVREKLHAMAADESFDWMMLARETGASPQDALNIRDRLRGKSPAEDDTEISFNPNEPAFDLATDKPKDWSSMPVDQTRELSPADKLSYLNWLNRKAPAEARQAYEQKFSNGPPTEFELQDLEAANVVGKNGQVDDSARARGGIAARAEPWASISRAEENALAWGQADLDADYIARRINAPEGNKLGLKPGVYVFSIPKVSAEQVRTKTGGTRTRGQAARAGIARAREKWDALPRDIKAQNDVPGAPKYGVSFIRTEKDGTISNVMFDAREITRIGLEVEPELQSVKNSGERLARAFFAGMAQIMDTEVNGVRYVPERTNKGNKTVLSGNTVIQETKNGGQTTLGAARRAYAAAVQAGESSATSPGREMADRDEEIARDKPEIDVPRNKQLKPATYLNPETGQRVPVKPSPGSKVVLEDPNDSADGPTAPRTATNDAIPVAERGQGGSEAERQGVRPPTSDTEERQNANSVDRRPTKVVSATERIQQAINDAMAATPVKKDLATAAQALAKFLGLGDIILHRDTNEYVADLEARGFNLHADNVRVMIAARARSGQATHAFMQTLPDGTTAIYVEKALPAQAIKYLTHELGHAFYRKHWDSATSTTRDAVKDEWRRQREAHLKRYPQHKSMTEARMFEEWMADQLSGWVAKHRAPQTLFEKYLGSLYDGFKKMWELIAKHFGVSASFEEFVAEVTKSRTVDNSSFDALGMHAEPYADDSTSLGDSRLSDKVALFRQKNPKVDAVMAMTSEAGKAAWDTVLSSLQGRIRRMNIKAFNDILGFFDYRPGEKGGHTYYTETDLRMQHFVRQYEKITKGMTKEDINQLHQEMLLERGLNALPPRLKEKGTQLRQMFDRLYAYQRTAHLPINKADNYFPAVGDKEQLSMPDAVDVISQALTANGIAHEREDVVEIVSSLKDDAFVNNYEPGALTDVDANSRSPFVQALRSRVLDAKWRDAIRSVKDKDGKARFYAKDMGEVMYRYINQAVRRAEYNKRLGDVKWDTNEVAIDATGKPQGFDPHAQLKQLIGKAREQGATPDQQAFMYDALSAFMGTHGRIKSEAARKLVNGTMAYQNLRTMSLVLLSSFPDLANNFVRTGNLTDTWKSIINGWKEAWKATEERDSLLRMVGHAQDVGDQTLLASMQSWWDNPNSTSAQISNGFFRAVGMHRWSAFTKALGARVSVDYINRHAVSADKGNQDSIKRLEELGITSTDVAVWNDSKQVGYGMPGWTEEDAQLGTAQYDTPAQLEAVKRVTGALARMVNEIHVNAKPPEKTLWGNAETMKLLFHLKSFMYGFASRVLSRVWYDISKDGSTTGDKAAAIAGLAMTLPLAAMGLELKDWLQNELWGRPSALKDKSGWEYMRLTLNRSGALGIATMGLDVGDAAAGGRAPLVALAGPTISQMNDVLQYGLYHSAAGAVPVLSSFPGWRDGVKEVLKNDE